MKYNAQDAKNRIVTRQLVTIKSRKERKMRNG